MYDQNPDARRLLGEVARIYVACDDCGHSRLIQPEALKKAQDLGVHTYRDLCSKLWCSACPRQEPEDRNLTIRPTWRVGEAAA